MSGDDAWEPEMDLNHTSTNDTPYILFNHSNSTVLDPIDAIASSTVSSFDTGSIVSLSFLVCATMYFVFHFGYARRRR